MSGGSAHSLVFNSQSRGVAILFNKRFDYKVRNQITDPNGNFLILDLEVLEKRISVACIYAPNRDDPDFFKDVKANLIKMGNENIIIVGDWNLLINPIKDGWNYKHVNHPKARRIVLDLLKELDLVDIWRDQHPKDLLYTWHKKKEKEIVQKG